MASVNLSSSGPDVTCCTFAGSFGFIERVLRRQDSLLESKVLFRAPGICYFVAERRFKLQKVAGDSFPLDEGGDGLSWPFFLHLGFRGWL